MAGTVPGISTLPDSSPFLSFLPYSLAYFLRKHFLKSHLHTNSHVRICFIRTPPTWLNQLLMAKSIFDQHRHLVLVFLECCNGLSKSMWWQSIDLQPTYLCPWGGYFGPLRSKYKWKTLVFHFTIFTSFTIAIICSKKEVLLYFIEEKVEAQTGHVISGIT